MLRMLSVGFCLTLFAASAGMAAASYSFVTLAGNALDAGSADGTGNAARFNLPTGVAVDNTGNVYVADQNTTTRSEKSPAAE